MFHCFYCVFKTVNFKEYHQHRSCHLSLSTTFICGYYGCKKNFQSKECARLHLIRGHGFSFESHKLQNRNTDNLENENGKYVCSLNVCKKQCDSYYTLIKHLKVHIRQGIVVTCPYKNCKNRIFNVVSSFSSHLTRLHPQKNTNQNLIIPELDFVNQTNAEGNPCNENIQSFDFNENDDLDTYNNRVICDDSTHENSVFLFQENLALFFLKLENQLSLPSSTVQYIVSQLCTFSKIGENKIRTKIFPRLLENGLSVSESEKIIESILSCNPLAPISKSLKTRYKRTQFNEKFFPYVEPIQISLQESFIKDDLKFFHYVPLAETLKNFLQSRSLEQKLLMGNIQNQGDVLKDFTDGLVFKRNLFFQENPNALKLILYQDSFEVVNPIGAAKTKYKILAIYLNVGNLPSYLRSRVNSIQLVALCKEKHFNHEIVYGKIVEDLKYIETKGIELPSGEIIKGALVFIAGDNLGSHSLAGFTENFSRAPYFCRYCLMSRKQFYADEGEFKKYDIRTPENYNEIIMQLEAIDDNNDDVGFDSYGIKFNSVFNRLSHFHVCSPGLPPCLGHDIFECLISYDVKLFLHNLKKAKWFNYAFLKSRMQYFDYSKEDRKDKPCFIDPLKPKIAGGAWQLWTFLRLLPLYLWDKIQDSDNFNWKAILLLTEIIEIVIAPEIHTSYIPYLQLLIREYIVLRKKLPQRLRPKHHFLLHYPELILLFGPLMKVWTLRFESKHMYFKKIVRMTKNYINVTQTLSVRHELFQSFIRRGGDNEKFAVNLKAGKNFNVNKYNYQIQRAVEDSRVSQSYMQYDRLLVKGITYREGDALIVSHEDYQCNIEIGNILHLLYDDTKEDYLAIVEVFETSFDLALRVYRIGKMIRYQCVNFDELSSNEKLYIYRTGSLQCVKPSFGLVSSINGNKKNI